MTHVSVCMATYNGANHVYEQVASIAVQLQPSDEIVVVDDGSSDGTRDEIDRALSNAKFDVHVLENEFNQGHVKAFERSIRAATNDVIVLADQDDVWIPGYLDTVRAAFESDASVGLTVARPVFCDADLQPIAEKNLRYRHPSYTGVFGVAAFLLNRAMPIGCTMSIRRADLGYILPFPKNLLAHDHWLFAMATVRRRMLPLNDEAIYYRRHDEVVSRKRRPNQMVLSRVQFIGQVLRRLLLSRRAR